MGLSRYLLHDFFTAHEFNRMDERMASLRRSRQRERRSAADLKMQVEELEDELGRMTLFARALAEACIRRGVLANEDIQKTLVELDMQDGVLDGKMGSMEAPEPKPAGKRPRYRRR